jgi:transaldolase
VLLLDSAKLEDVVKVSEFGFVGGVTMNPTLLARCGSSSSPHAHLRSLVEMAPGQIFFQPLSSNVDRALRESLEAHDMAPDRIVVKLPATLPLVGVGRQLKARRVAVAATAVFSPAQALIAHAAGFDWVIPYVNRAEQLSADDRPLVARLAEELAALGSITRILAASLKRPEQVSNSILEGAHAVTCPLALIEDCAEHPLTEAAIEQFAQAGQHEMSKG